MGRHSLLLHNLLQSPGLSICQLCSGAGFGTQIYAKRDGRDHVYLRQGSLDMQLGVKEVAHTWTSHSPDWFDLDGNLLRYAQDKPDFSQAPDGADDFSTSMGRLVARRFLPVAILIRCYM